MNVYIIAACGIIEGSDRTEKIRTIKRTLKDYPHIRYIKQEFRKEHSMYLYTQNIVAITVMSVEDYNKLGL